GVGDHASDNARGRLGLPLEPADHGNHEESEQEKCQARAERTRQGHVLLLVGAKNGIEREGLRLSAARIGYPGNSALARRGCRPGQARLWAFVTDRWPRRAQPYGSNPIGGTLN